MLFQLKSYEKYKMLHKKTLATNGVSDYNYENRKGKEGIYIENQSIDVI